MYFKSTFFEDYQLNDKHVTLDRTITETDFVVRAGHTGGFPPHYIYAEWCTNLRKAEAKNQNYEP